jgi:hypothetical protein
VTGPDYETLLRSPLDDEPESSGWGSAILGLVGGGITVFSLSLVLGLWSTPDEALSTIPATDPATTETVTTVETAISYPDGFAEIGGSVAMKATGVVSGDTAFIVSFATATERGHDPATTLSPLGGRWQIENTSGSVTGTTRLLYDRLNTGVIGAEFPGYPGEGDAIRMTERWDSDERTSSVDIPFTATPFSTADAVELDLGDGVTLRFDNVDLGRHLGRIVWALSGVDDPRGVAIFDVVMFDVDGVAVGEYLSMPSPRDPTQSGGVTELFWNQGFNVHPDEGSTVRVSATVQLISPQPVDVLYQLDSVPSGN